MPYVSISLATMPPQITSSISLANPSSSNPFVPVIVASPGPKLSTSHLTIPAGPKVSPSFTGMTKPGLSLAPALPKATSSYAPLNLAPAPKPSSSTRPFSLNLAPRPSVQQEQKTTTSILVAQPPSPTKEPSASGLHLAPAPKPSPPTTSGMQLAPAPTRPSNLPLAPVSKAAISVAPPKEQMVLTMSVFIEPAACQCGAVQCPAAENLRALCTQAASRDCKSRCSPQTKYYTVTVDATEAAVTPAAIAGPI
ncbi:hypothetical protein BT63DRAFT_39754 [Microthyrium microscopicum]|uniref:Uncharacterized protein n=1 Tax=Microthyrium microscopicum TaxID=703497 RepID=A0A6A6UVR1_9PEZI|nr:hypothetical protein BT63DRAFT_39754 [Microthyrium microscopicum]